MARTFPRHIPKVLKLTEQQKARVPKGLEIKFGLNRAKQKNGTIYVTERAYYIDPKTNSPRAIGSVKIGHIPVGSTEIVYDNKAAKSKPVKPDSTSPKVWNLARETLCDDRRQECVTMDMASFWTVCLLASLTGKNTAVHIADYLSREGKTLRRLLPGLPDKPVSHDTIRRLMTLLKPEEGLKLAFKLSQPMLGDMSGHVVSIDGQAVCASRNEAGRAMFLLNFFDSQAETFLGHLMIDMKKNEYSEAEILLSHFDIAGTTLTADALFCKRDFIELVLKKGADYCIPVKDNCKLTKRAIAAVFDTDFDQAKVFDYEAELDHGRIEQRQVRVLPGRALPQEILSRWGGLDEGCIVQCRSSREDKKSAEVSTQTRYCITSKRWDEKDIERVIAETIRYHRRIENTLHRNADIVFDQDRIQAKNASYVNTRTLLNKLALNVISEYRRKTGGNLSLSRTMEKMRDATEAKKCLEMVYGGHLS